MTFESDLLGRTILLPSHHADPLHIEAQEADGDFYHLRLRTAGGRLIEITLTAQELREALAELPAQRPAIVSGTHLALMIEAERIRRAYAYDPYFAVSLCGVEPLPHQLEAVYERMLPQARMRFILADDPGAGKTIMAGLLIKELKMRQTIERILVLCPAPLTLQWQDEMRTRFDEIFEVIRAENAKDQLGGSVWQRFSQCIASIDFAKRDDVAPELLRASWDLVVIDEAHKCAARWFGDEVRRTRRYVLAEALSDRAERLLLLTATPHSGSAEQFAYLLRLLDQDQFVGPDRVDNYAQLNQQALMLDEQVASPWFLRRSKEDLRSFDGARLFTQRTAITVSFELSEAELALYQAVTDYINRYLPRQTGRKQAPVALARTVLQRRLASSVRAIARSLERRHARFSAILQDSERLPSHKQEDYLRSLSLLEAYDDEQDIEDADDALAEAAESLSIAERLADLRAETQALGQLVRQAQALEASRDERKLRALLDCLERAEFAELADGRGKLLIFTEHKDTLDYLTEALSPRYTCVQIHGGMNAISRKQAQETFRTSAQVCIATDAAGEGINLQFCHLMINYDLPWNPTRLEQRMGRIHRIGQKLDVYIFNFVASNTVEGRVLQTLLHKLNEIRAALGDRVFDVIGMMLRLNDVDLEDILRQAAHNPRSLDDDFYLQQIRRLDPQRLTQLEQATGVALATRQVDLERVRARDQRSAERRLMPEYVQRFFLEAAEMVGLRVEQRADGLFRVDHVPQRFADNHLTSVRRFGPPDRSYNKLTFDKTHILRQPKHADAVLLSPGHPLFAAVSEVLEDKLAAARGAWAFFRDGRADAPYRLHAYALELESDEPRDGGYQGVVQYAALGLILEDEQGQLEQAPPDTFHDLLPLDGPPSPGFPLPTLDRARLEAFARRIVHQLRKEQLAERERQLEIRRAYLQHTRDGLLLALQRKYVDLCDKVNSGQEQYRIARDEALRRIDELEGRYQQKLDALRYQRVLRDGPLRYLGSAYVLPALAEGEAAAALAAMRRDDAVEARAMAFVMEYERRRGWTPEDISRRADGSGFDVYSLGPADAHGQRPVQRIEVKGRSGYHQPVALSVNEWLQAQRHADTYWLYVVWGCGAEQTPQLLRIQNPSRRLARVAQAVIRHYLIDAEALIDQSQP
ncbi:MAG: helicase-related protein [Anaerolineae bacterium]|nr:helicase-related protein [Anaerolineae bacterium]MDW8173734.1 helicase-related protein [Anaerolineae bacterium]